MSQEEFNQAETESKLRMELVKQQDQKQRVDETVKQRQWVGLTPQERDEINEKVYGAVPHHVAFHHAIEAKLKEKNT